MFKRRLFREHSFKTDHEDLYWTVYSFAKCVQTFEIFLSRISPAYIRELKRSFWATVENRKCTLPVAARGSNTSRAKAPYYSSPPSLPQALICLLSPTSLINYDHPGTTPKFQSTLTGEEWRRCVRGATIAWKRDTVFTLKILHVIVPKCPGNFCERRGHHFQKFSLPFWISPLRRLHRAARRWLWQAHIHFPKMNITSQWMKTSIRHDFS